MASDLFSVRSCNLPLLLMANSINGSTSSSLALFLFFSNEKRHERLNLAETIKSGGLRKFLGGGEQEDKKSGREMRKQTLVVVGFRKHEGASVAECTMLVEQRT